MQITISKQTAKVLQKAIWLTVQTCNENRAEKTFKPNERIMKEMGVSVKNLYDIHLVSEQINKKLSTKNKRK